MSTASPCIKLCRMEAGLCVGCLRTLDEIARWGSSGEAEKCRILQAVSERRHALFRSDASGMPAG